MTSQTENINMHLTNVPPTYCLLSDNDLHFLPYSINNNISINENYKLYSKFLNNKTISSFDNHFYSSQNNQKIANSIDLKYSKNDQISQILKNYNSHAIYLPDSFIPISDLNSENDEIKSLLLKIFTHWINKSNIKIKILTGGITNILLECSYKNLISGDVEKILVRAYGNGTDLIIDRDREFVSHLFLNSLDLAPPIHARFGNGLVYGFIEGRSLNYDELSSNNLYPLIASKLACLHKSCNINTIEISLNKLKQKFNSNNSNFENPSQTNIWSILYDWIDKLPVIPSIMSLCKENEDLIINKNKNKKDIDLNSVQSILKNEIDWLKNELKSTSLMVTSHNDLLSGNIIIPSSFDKDFDSAIQSYKSNPLQFIDYEYMMPAPRAFDIANHFMEWQGFDCDKSKIPQFKFNKITNNYENDIVFNWCKYYLNAFNLSNPNINPFNNSTNTDIHQIDNKSIQNLVNEIAYHYGMPGLYWGIWACIQSEISLIDFDYYSYSCQRLIEYWNWKRVYLANKK